MDFSSISNIKQLNSEQYTRCRENALKLVKRRIGEKPSRKQFEKEYAPILTILDKLAFLVFLSSFAISATHIFIFSGEQANTSYVSAVGTILGVSIPSFLFGITHQLGFLVLSEASTILFATMASLAKGREKYLLWFLALCAAGFVLMANLNSNLHPFLGVLTPIFTLGTSTKLKTYFVEKIRRNNEIDAKYHEALEQWQIGTSEPEKHPMYKNLFAAELWSKLSSLKANVDWIAADNETKRLAVLREIEIHENVFGNLDMPVLTNAFLPATQPIHSMNGHSKIVPINQDI